MSVQSPSIQKSRMTAPSISKEKFSRELTEELARQGEVDNDLAADIVPYATARLLSSAMEARATDIHLDPQSDHLHIRFRIDGFLHNQANLSLDDGNQLINQIKTVGGLDPIESFIPKDGRRRYSIQDRTLDLRITSTSCIAGEKLAVRILDPRKLDRKIEELGMAEEQLLKVENWLGNINGTFLISGPTGSGKTTTLYALLHRLKHLRKNIVTLEDPVEYQVNGITQLQVNDTRGMTYANGIKAMMRLDPDYLLLGEIRDKESGQAAIHAACSGHILLSTLHGRDAVSAVTSLRNWGLDNHEISSALSVVVAQRLVRKLCPRCRVQEAPAPREREWYQMLGITPPEHVWHARGCDACGRIGFHGRTGVFEVWQLDEDQYELIVDGADERRIRRHLSETGHGFLLPDGLEKVEKGITTVSELKTMGGYGYCLKK